MAITLRKAKAKKEILPRSLGDSGGGDGGGGDSGGASVPSGGGDGFSVPTGEAFGGTGGGWEGSFEEPNNYGVYGGQGSEFAYGGGGGGGTGSNPTTTEEAPPPPSFSGSGGMGGMPTRFTTPIEPWVNPYAVNIDAQLAAERLAAMQSARGIAEGSYYQKLIRSQGAPPSGGGGGGGESSAWNRGSGRTAGEGGYYTGLIPPGTGGANLEMPAYDLERVSALAQQVAAPGIKKLRDQVQQVQGGVYDNPNVKGMTLRQALQGYGSGLESVMSGATTTGAGMYDKEYGALATEATTNYRGNLERELQAQRLATQERISEANLKAGKENAYQNAWNEWNNVWN